MERVTAIQPAASKEARVGDTVVAADGVLGHVDRIIRSETTAPVYLVVVAGGLLRRRYPVIPFALVRGVDRTLRCVSIEGHRQRLGRFSESVPIVL